MMIRSQFPEDVRSSTQIGEILSKTKRPFIPRFRKIAIVHRDLQLVQSVEAARIETIAKAISASGYKVLRIAAPDFKRPSADVDLTLALGGDGTCLKTAAHLSDTPLCGINLMPEISIGFLSSLRFDELDSFLEKFDAQMLNMRPLTRMQAIINGDNDPYPILNDCLFASKLPAAASKYELCYQTICESQSSSGVWISTPVGSNAAIYSAGGKQMDTNERRFQFRVREPNGIRKSKYQIFEGFIQEDTPFSLSPQKEEMSLYFDGGIKEIALAKDSKIQFAAHPFPLWQIII